MLCIRLDRHHLSYWVLKMPALEMSHKAYCFIFSEQPADLATRERDGLGGQGCRVDVTAHQYIHLFFRLHLGLLGGRTVTVTLCGSHQTADDTRWSWSYCTLTSWCILWYTFASLSRTTKDWEGSASPLKMKLRSPRWHFISVKSIRVVSSLNQERGGEQSVKSVTS